MADSFVADAAPAADSFTPDPKPVTRRQEGTSYARADIPSVKDVATHGAGAVADTLGLGRKGARTPAGVILNPEGAAEKAASLAVTIPAFYGAGALAPATPLLARATLAGGLGGAAGAQRGESAGGATMSALLDAAVSAATEGVITRAPRVGLNRLARPVEDAAATTAEREAGFKGATDSVKTAVDAIKARLPANARVRVPALMKPGETRITVEEAVKRLQDPKMVGADYRVARAELASQLNGLDTQAVTPRAGSAFKMRSAPEKFTPPPVEPPSVVARGAEAAKSAIPAVDAVATQHDQGIPQGLPAVGGAAERMWNLRHLLPLGGGH